MATRDLTKNQKKQRDILKKMTKQTERQVAREYKKALDNIRIALAKLYEKYAVKGILSNAEMTRFNRLSNLEKELTIINRELGTSVSRDITKMQRIQIDQSFFRYAWAVDQNLGIELKWGQISDAIIKEAVANPLKKISLIELNARTKNRINRTITQGLIKGSTIKEMANGIKSVYGGEYKNAVRTVRTESHKIVEAGIQEQFLKGQKLGVKLRKMLISTLDDRTRAQSAQMDTQVSDENGLFTYPDGTKAIPGQTGNPAWDINDRERSIEIVEGYSAVIRRTRDQGLTPFKSFKKWAKEHGIKKNRYGQRLF